MLRIFFMISLYIIMGGGVLANGLSNEQCIKMAEVVNKLSPAVNLDEYVADQVGTVSNTSLNTIFEENQYYLKIIDKEGFKYYFNLLENNISFDLMDTVTKGLGIGAVPIESAWENFLFSVKNRSKADNISCDKSLGELDQQLLLFYSLYGSEIWEKNERVLRIVVNEKENFLFYISELPNNSYSGRLLHLVGDQLASYFVFYNDEIDLHRLLVETVMLNTESIKK